MVSLLICQWNLGQVIQTLTRTEDFLNRRLILRVVHVAVNKHTCCGFLTENFVHMLAEQTRFVPSEERLSRGIRQLRLEMCANDPESARGIHLNSDIKKSPLNQRSLSVKIKFDALFRMSLHNFKSAQQCNVSSRVRTVYKLRERIAQVGVLQSMPKICELILRPHFGNAQNIGVNLFDDSNKYTLLALRLGTKDGLTPFPPVLLEIILEIIMSKND